MKTMPGTGEGYRPPQSRDQPDLSHENRREQPGGSVGEPELPSCRNES